MVQLLLQNLHQPFLNYFLVWLQGHLINALRELAHIPAKEANIHGLQPLIYHGLLPQS